MSVDSLYRLCLLFLKVNPNYVNCDRMHYQSLEDLVKITNNPLYLKETETIKVRLIYSSKNLRALITKVIYKLYPEDFRLVNRRKGTTATKIPNILKYTDSRYIVNDNGAFREVAVAISTAMHYYAVYTTLCNLSDNTPKDIFSKFLKFAKNGKVDYNKIMLLVSATGSERLLLSDAGKLGIASEIFDFPENLVIRNT